jgi:hypothetical protein
MKNEASNLFSEFIELNPIEMNKINGGEKTVIICKLGQKVYACANWEAKCEKGFTYGCEGGYVACGSGFILTPIK